MNNRVTILIVSYNHEKYIRKCIESVTGQTHKELDIVVIDDYSTDNTADIIREMQQTHNFKFIHNKENKGLNFNMMLGLSEVEGDFFSTIAADDYMAPGKTEKLLNYLRVTGKDGVYANCYTLQNDKVEPATINKVFDTDDKSKILKYIYTHDWESPLFQSGMFSKHLINDMIPLRKQYASDDWAIMIKFFQDFNIGFLNEPLFYYRLHLTNSHKSYWKTFPMRIEVAAKLVPGKYKTKSISNILRSQGNYLLHDEEYLKGTRFHLAALFLSFSFSKLSNIIRSHAVFFRNKLTKKKQSE